jgi:poly(beta-D-mannuronate) lyase
MIAGLSMTFAKLQGLDSGPSDRRHDIAAWLHRLAADMRNFYDALPPTSTVKLNNHRYWAGYAAAAAAVITGDKGLLTWAADSFKVGVCAVDDAGSLPLELRRGARALGYMFYAMGPLVMIDRIAARNGLDIHGTCRDGLDRLTQFSVEQALNPALINRLSGTAQQPVITTDGKLNSRSGFAWLEAYQDRLKAFPKFEAAFHATRPFSSGEFGGNTTDLFRSR